MKIKLTTLMKNKFNISNPHKVLKDLKQFGKISSPSLRKVFEDTPPERFDIEIVKKYIKYISSHSNKQRLQYDPEYWMYRYNISHDSASQKVIDFKTNKSTSKENFTKRHGEELGTEMFEKFQKTSAYSTSDEWFIDKYGDDWEEQKKYFGRKKSKRCIEYWTNHGYGEIEAAIKVSEYQSLNAGVNIEYYKSRGYSATEINVIMKSIRQKQKQHHRNINYLKEKYPNDWKKIYEESSKKYRKRMEELGIWIPDSIIDNFKKYKCLVERYTNQSVLFYGELIKKLEMRSKQFQLDHKYSIKMGYLNDIPAEIVGSIVNLEILPGTLNASKKEKCSITKQHLLNQYKIFKENYENQKD